jgi:hypothetical protein
VITEVRVEIWELKIRRPPLFPLLSKEGMKGEVRKKICKQEKKINLRLCQYMKK